MAEEKGSTALTDKDADVSLSMVDVLEESEELEDEANAVLGGSDDKYCTYVQGAVNRQAIYACATCITSDMDPAGVCLACSYECHEGHDLVEMYTKRNFTCDCGNDRFPNMTCKFFTNKAKVNSDNKYNDNFRGLYCICKRPYPDPEDKIEDEMIQCIVCEDWFHGRHLGATPPLNLDYEEMICRSCMQVCDFLWPYVVSSVEMKIVTDDSKVPINVEGGHASTSDGDKLVDHIEGQQGKEVTNGNDGLKVADENKQSSGEGANRNETETRSSDVAEQGEANASSNDSSVEVMSNSCKLQELKKRGVPAEDQATFWPTGWRKKLCTCAECMQLYEEKHVAFLTDLKDTVHQYEEHGKSKQTDGSQYEQGIRALSNMDRVQQVEVMHGYNDMKTELKDYLKSFVDQGKVVRAEDISEFFETMQARKRQRTDSGPKVQHFCR
ncbi:putative E3 ubiquitin-protein ligase UBR7 [Saccoglossus kowalevskii]|uniref:E3 ubiquitin-protein ligase UBR7-like n=1 Tax=Saccoglossus kowalevskii TaxID=10224 RepID=A0ABM0GTH9_SACKO|nr:PREDICTED: putative E3 ubiquitin-protein ligase UBR7-like [Saccoglossus kowalevskii]